LRAEYESLNAGCRLHPYEQLGKVGKLFQGVLVLFVQNDSKVGPVLVSPQVQLFYFRIS